MEQRIPPDDFGNVRDSQVTRSVPGVFISNDAAMEFDLDVLLKIGRLPCGGGVMRWG